MFESIASERGLQLRSWENRKILVSSVPKCHCTWFASNFPTKWHYLGASWCETINCTAEQRGCRGTWSFATVYLPCCQGNRARRRRLNFHENCVLKNHQSWPKNVPTETTKYTRVASTVGNRKCEKFGRKPTIFLLEGNADTVTITLHVQQWKQMSANFFLEQFHVLWSSPIFSFASCGVWEGKTRRSPSQKYTTQV